LPANPYVLSLIPLIYDAAEDPALWPNVLKEIGQLLKAVGKVVAIDDPSEGRNNMAIAVDIDPVYQRLYDKHYESINIHIQRARPLLLPGRVIATHQFCSDKETLSSEYYHEFLRPQKDWFYVVGGCVAKDHSLLSVVNFIRGRRAGHFTDREIKLLEGLMPHLRCAVRLHQVFAQHQNVTACLEILPIAALFVTEHGHVQFANRAANEILLIHDGLGIDRRGCLTSTNKRLREIVAAACHAAAGCGEAAGGSLLIARTSGKRSYGVSVSPIRRANLFLATKCAGAVVFVIDPETKREPIAEVLRRLYDLTPAEARLASLIVDGKDVNEACAELGIRRTTVRTHLRRLSDKLGARRQAEVVAVILRTAGILGSGFDNH
jgi:DNA-binding CsgD family transcriptional regulator